MINKSRQFLGIHSLRLVFSIHKLKTITLKRAKIFNCDVTKMKVAEQYFFSYVGCGGDITCDQELFANKSRQFLGIHSLCLVELDSQVENKHT